MAKGKGNGAGRPLKFETPEKMQEAIDAYFAACDRKHWPYTITGLALALGTTRQLLCQYDDKPQFSYTIKAAKARVEDFAERSLYTIGGSGPIFWLKNHGWRDKSEVENTHTFTQMGKITKGTGKKAALSVSFDVGDEPGDKPIKPGKEEDDD